MREKSRATRSRKQRSTDAEEVKAAQLEAAAKAQASRRGLLRDPAIAGLFDDALVSTALNRIDRPELQARALDELEERYGWWEAARRMILAGPRGLAVALERWGQWLSDASAPGLAMAGAPGFAPTLDYVPGSQPARQQPLPLDDQPMLRLGRPSPGEKSPRAASVDALYPQGMVGRGVAVQAKQRPTSDDEPILPERLLERLGPGRSLDPELRARMEQLFGVDLEQVRIHEDAQAGELAEHLAADAFALGRNIVFAPGKFAPSSEEGEALLAHELTHVVQQAKGESPVQQGDAPSGSRGAAQEQEADRMAERARRLRQARAGTGPRASAHDASPAGAVEKDPRPTDGSTRMAQQPGASHLEPEAAARVQASHAESSLEGNSEARIGSARAQQASSEARAGGFEPHKLSLEERPTDVQLRPKHNRPFPPAWLDVLLRTNWAVPQTDPRDKKDPAKGVKPEDVDLAHLFDAGNPLAAVRQALTQLKPPKPSKGEAKPAPEAGGQAGKGEGGQKPARAYAGFDFKPVPAPQAPAKGEGGGKAPDGLAGIQEKVHGAKDGMKIPQLRREYELFAQSANQTREGLKQAAKTIQQGISAQADEAIKGVQLEGKQVQKGISEDAAQVRARVQGHAQNTRKSLEASYKQQLAALTQANTAERDRAIGVARAHGEDLERLYRDKAKAARKLGNDKAAAILKHAGTQAALARAAGAAVAAQYAGHDRASEIRSAISSLAADGAKRILETANTAAQTLRKDGEALAAKIEQEGRAAVANLAKGQKDTTRHFAELLGRAKQELAGGHKDSLEAIAQAEKQALKGLADMQRSASASVRAHEQEQIRGLNLAKNEAQRAFAQAIKSAFQALDDHVSEVEAWAEKAHPTQWFQVVQELKRANKELLTQGEAVRQELLQGLTQVRGLFLNNGQEIVRGLMLARQKIQIKLNGISTDIEKGLEGIKDAHDVRLRGQVQGLAKGWAKEADEKIQSFTAAWQKARKDIVDLYDKGEKQILEKYEGTYSEINSTLAQIRKDLKSKAEEIANRGGFWGALKSFFVGMVKGLWNALTGFLKSILIVLLIVLVIVIVVALVIVLFWGVGALMGAIAAVASFLAAAASILSLLGTILTVITVIGAALKMFRAFTEAGLSPEERGVRFGEALGDLITEFGPDKIIKRFTKAKHLGKLDDVSGVRKSMGQLDDAMRSGKNFEDVAQSARNVQNAAGSVDELAPLANKADNLAKVSDEAAENARKIKALSEAGDKGGDATKVAGKGPKAKLPDTPSGQAYQAAQSTGYKGSFQNFEKYYSQGRRFNLKTRRWYTPKAKVPTDAPAGLVEAFEKAKNSGYGQSYEQFAKQYSAGKRFNEQTRRWYKPKDVPVAPPKPVVEPPVDVVKPPSKLDKPVDGPNNYDPEKAPEWLKKAREKARLEAEQNNIIRPRLQAAYDLYKGIALSLYQFFAGLGGDGGLVDNAAYLWKTASGSGTKAPAKK